MAMLALVLSVLAALTLLALDFIVIRRTERRLSSEITEGEASKPSEDMPPILMAARVLVTVFGWLNFPATLAPVILVALTAKRFDWISDGQAALMAIFVAGLSMSASLKAMRIGEYLEAGEARYMQSLRQCVAYVLGWTVLVLSLLVASETATPMVGRVVLTYTIMLVGFAAFMMRVHQQAPSWMKH